MNTLKRQGDVLLERVADSLGDLGARIFDHNLTASQRRGVIAEGEMTGHAHKLVGGELLATSDGLVAIVEERAEVEHDEHATLELEPGVWLVHRQTEYVSEDERVQVFD